MAPSVKKPSAQAIKQQATAAANRSPERQPHRGKQNAPTTKSTEQAQQSTAAANRSSERQPPKGKQTAPATEYTEQAPLPKRSPRKHVASPGPLSVPRSSKRVKTHDTAETASEGEAHAYACVDGENIDDPDKEGDPTCRGLCHEFFLRLHSLEEKIMTQPYFHLHKDPRAR